MEGYELGKDMTELKIILSEIRAQAVQNRDMLAAIHNRLDVYESGAKAKKED